MNKTIAGVVLACLLPAAHAAEPAISALKGTWTLVAADVERADGRRLRDYGSAPKGRLFIDQQGRYSLQIFKSERSRFATIDKNGGTDAEFKAAVLGSSTHYGTIGMEGNTLVFHVEAASFPNWEGTVQRRSFELKENELSYRVPPRPDGGTPVSVWHRIM